MIKIIRSLSTYLKVNLLYQRGRVIILLRDDAQRSQVKRPKIIAVIAHITSVEEAQNKEKGLAKIEKLQNTIDGLLASFAHCELTIVVKTVAGRHITAYLPDYQLSCIHVKEETGCDPMFIGFTAQDEFVKTLDKFDWFIFIEDDIVVSDSYMLEKLEIFNAMSGYDRAVLLPNRYEFWEGTKRYIDLTIDPHLAWNRLSAVEIEGVKFAECTNPHSGIYCLSKSQMKVWSESPRNWKNKNLGFGGPRECAATYCLLECFSLYKPHFSNLHYFEVKHYDTKYSKLYPDQSPSYIFSPIKKSSKLNQAVEAL